MAHRAPPCSTAASCPVRPAPAVLVALVAPVAPVPPAAPAALAVPALAESAPAAAAWPAGAGAAARRGEPATSSAASALCGSAAARPAWKAGRRQAHPCLVPVKDPSIERSGDLRIKRGAHGGPTQQRRRLRIAVSRMRIARLHPQATY